MGILLISTLIAILAAGLALVSGSGLLLTLAIYTATGVMSCILMAAGVVLRCWILRQQVGASIPVDPPLARDIRS